MVSDDSFQLDGGIVVSGWDFMAEFGALTVEVCFFLLSLAAIAYLVLCLRHVLPFRVSPVLEPAKLPPLSVLKPLCGDEPRLYECLRSFCDQDYPDFHLVFGVHRTDDPAILVVERLKREFPHLDISLVCDATSHGANRKISNVLNMMPLARHELVIVSDSDVEVGRDCYGRVAADAADPKVGAVSCIYKGAATGGLVAALGAININDWIIPSVLLERGLNGVEASLGPVMLLRRPALDAIGGFQAVANHLAEDHELGERLGRAGWTVRLSDYAVDTMVSEESLSALFRHEVRWAHTVRAVRPLDHFLSGVTCLLPVLLVLAAIHPLWWTSALCALYLGLRLWLDRAIQARFRLAAPTPWWLVPMRESLCFAVWFYACFSRAVVWRGQAFKLMPGGRLVPQD
jgi:ceramide glucosyltransferase